MAEKSFSINVVTPAGKILSGQAVSAVLPAHDGQIGFLPNRAPIVLELGLGELRVDFANDNKNTGGGSRTYLVEDGFAQMANNKLTVLTTSAWAVEELDLKQAEAELAAASGKTSADTRQMETLTRNAERARAKVRLARDASGKGI